MASDFRVAQDTTDSRVPGGPHNILGHLAMADLPMGRTHRQICAEKAGETLVASSCTHSKEQVRDWLDSFHINFVGTVVDRLEDLGGA